MTVPGVESIATRAALGFLLTQKVMRPASLHSTLNELIAGLGRGNPPLLESDICFVHWVIRNLSTTTAAHVPAFRTAVRINFTEAVKALVLHGEVPQGEYFRQFLEAVGQGNMPMVRAFLETGKMAGGFNDQSFRTACRGRDFATLNSLTSAPISPLLFSETLDNYRGIADSEMVAHLSAFKQAALFRPISASPDTTTEPPSATPPKDAAAMTCETVSPPDSVDFLDDLLLFPNFQSEETL